MGSLDVEGTEVRITSGGSPDASRTRNLIRTLRASLGTIGHKPALWRPPEALLQGLPGLENKPISSHFPNGANRDRTGDLLLAKQALSQLSYGPAITECRRPSAAPASVVSGFQLAVELHARLMALSPLGRSSCGVLARNLPFH